MRMNTTPAALLQKLQSERSQPRSGDIFVEPRWLVNRSSGGAAYSVAHKWAKPLRIICFHKYCVPNGTQDRFPFASISSNASLYLTLKQSTQADSLSNHHQDFPFTP